MLIIQSCSKVDYVRFSSRKIAGKESLGVITFNVKAIYEREDSDIDNLMKILNSGRYDFVVLQELFDESTREKIVAKTDTNLFSTIISRVDYNSFPE